MKLQTKLNNWGKTIVKVVTDEDIWDISLAIKYHDRGDEFLYVRTYSGEEYKYGYYLDRKDCFANFDPDLNGKEDVKHGFIRRPFLYKQPDQKSIMSNKVFWLLRNNYSGIQAHMDFGPQKYDNADSRLSYICDGIKRIIKEHPDTKYEFSRYKEQLMTFIKVNGLGEDCIQEVNDIPWNSRIDGVDGIAGKKKSSNILYGDGVKEVLYRGKRFDIKKLTYSVIDYDEFGFETYALNTKQLV